MYMYVGLPEGPPPPELDAAGAARSGERGARSTPNLTTKTIPTKIARLTISGNFPMDMRIPPLKVKILLESNKPSEIQNLSTEIGRSTGTRSRRRFEGAPHLSARSADRCFQARFVSMRAFCAVLVSSLLRLGVPFALGSCFGLASSQACPSHRSRRDRALLTPVGHVYRYIQQSSPFRLS